jgi:two-component system, chemotaxis family, chemotaxis protein CheY
LAEILGYIRIHLIPACYVVHEAFQSILPEKKPIGDTEELENFLSQAGLAWRRRFSKVATVGKALNSWGSNNRVSKKILIAEDSSTMRSLIVSTIVAMGDFEIVEAANGFEALRILPREKVDLVITDINMPDINGLELVSFIKSNENYKNTPLFIISTEGSERDRAKGLSLGADVYLTKPFSPQELQALIVRFLGQEA